MSELVTVSQIHKVLIDSNFNRSLASQKLGVSRSYLYSRLKTMLPVPVRSL
jgi:transcriptional regulator with PAS, ATPase and Fis domain